MSDSIQNPTKTPTDGRRLRSEASRGRIVDAMIAIVREKGGLGLPPAELVAERAGVGLRTVFRLFEDMDGVYRAMQAVITAEAEPLMVGRPPTGDARTDLEAEVERRARLFELILPLQVAADSQRHRSPALQEGRARLVRQQREALLAVAPPALTARPQQIAALELAVSFEAWRRLRTDQGASPDEACAIMTWMALALLDGATA
ncbi:MAG: TetR/AcrR family transcriptional regulator [Caulobacter sp.]|nr:TetR/AcrR family transcriptional regulator [Caulobacter sp.]